MKNRIVVILGVASLLVTTGCHRHHRHHTTTHTHVVTPVPVTRYHVHRDPIVVRPTVNTVTVQTHQECEVVVEPIVDTPSSHPHGLPPGQVGKDHPHGMPPGQAKKLQPVPVQNTPAQPNVEVQVQIQLDNDNDQPSSSNGKAKGRGNSKGKGRN